MSEGFVTLSTAGAGKEDGLASCSHADGLAPCGEGRSPELAIRVGGNEMAAGAERVVDGGVSGQEALRGPGRPEPLRLAFSSSDRQVRALNSIVHSSSLDVLLG